MRATDGSALIIALALAWSLYRAHRDETLIQFNLLDLIIENGRVSKIAFAFLVALGVTSYVMIRVTADGKMTDLLFAAYGGMWVAPIVAKLFSVPTSTTTTQTSESKVTVTK